MRTPVRAHHVFRESDRKDHDISSMLRMLYSELIESDRMSEVLRGEAASTPCTVAAGEKVRNMLICSRVV